MSDLLLMSPPGLPRNGLVALWDPYRDAYGLDAAARAALQTGVDYSGNGNTLIYGADTNASTDDPVNTGTAWSFDGGDYLTGGRPAQLEVSQPFCGYVVLHDTTDGATHPVVAKNSATLATGAGRKGSALVRASNNKIYGYAFKADGTLVSIDGGTVNNASGHVGVFFGWDGSYLCMMNGGVWASPVAMADHAADDSVKLTIGSYAHIQSVFLTGEVNLLAMWAGVCWPTAVATRIHNYAKSLFAGRGLTVA